MRRLHLPRRRRHPYIFSLAQFMNCDEYGESRAGWCAHDDEDAVEL